MSLPLSSDTGLTVLDMKSAVKIKGSYFGESGGQVSVGQEMFLDVIVKLTTGKQGITKSQKKFKILVESIIVYDGLSMRRMKSGDVRNKFRMKGAGKTSVKNRRKDKDGEIAKQLIGIGMEVSGTALVGPIYSVGKAILGKWKGDIEGSDSSAFEANLVVKSSKEEVGTLKSVTEKWNGYVLQGDEDSEFELDANFAQDKPVLRNISYIDINCLGGRELGCRINVPISGLNSDMAKGITIITETVISLLDDDGMKTQIARHYGELKGEYRYTTLLESTPYGVSPQ